VQVVPSDVRRPPQQVVEVVADADEAPGERVGAAAGEGDHH
jgi:hypothetical protein